MSFSLTTPQIRNRTKTVTRRLRWWHLNPGDVIQACVKCMGLKKGDHIERLAKILIVSTRSESLDAITPEDLILEGFPDLTPEQFITMFCTHNRCTPTTKVNRIEFEYL